MSSSCEVSPPIPSGISTDLTRLINDNYTILFIYSGIMIGLLICLYLVGKDVIDIVFDYFRYKDSEEYSPSKDESEGMNLKDVTQDNEFYPMEDDEPITHIKKPKDFREESQKGFYKSVDKAYAEYNDEKGKYILQRYNGRKNDDKIDDNIAYSRYDDYRYDDYDYSKK